MEFEKLLSPGKIGDLEVKNRVVMPPMGAGLANRDCFLSDDEIAYYIERAKGGIGMIISSVCCVTSDFAGIGSPDTVNLELKGNRYRIRKAVDGIHQYGAKFIVQLFHIGREGRAAVNYGQQVVGPSAIQEAFFTEMPRALETWEVKAIVKAFIDAAQVAFDGGADGVELHGAHGYLIHQFMSPRANQRTDEYGGSFENRMRFVTEIVEGIKAIRPAGTIISIRMNGRDGFEGGLTIEDCVEIAKYLESIGLDCLNVSQATYTNFYDGPDPAIKPEGSRSHFVAPIKAAVNIPVIAVDNIKRPETAEKLLNDGILDFVGLARPSLCDPAWTRKTAEGRPEEIRSCIGCNNCFSLTGGRVQCSLNPYVGNELKYNDDTVVMSGTGKNAVVIGAGPGGMNACEVLARKGYKVTLLDKNSELGGTMILARKGMGKEKVKWTIDGYAARLAKVGVDVKLNCEVQGIDDIAQFEPAVVVVAVGGDPVAPPVEGLDGPNVIQAQDLLVEPDSLKDKNVVVVGSGMTGLETAEILVSNGNRVTMYDMLDEMAKGAENINKTAIMGYLAQNGVTFNTDHRMTRVTETGVIFQDLKNNTEVFAEADVVVLSLGVRSNRRLEQLDGQFDKVIFVGDCSKPGKIVSAVRDKFDELWNI